jgi:hypothetical protein
LLDALENVGHVTLENGMEDVVCLLHIRIDGLNLFVKDQRLVTGQDGREQELLDSKFLPEGFKADFAANS